MDRYTVFCTELRSSAQSLNASKASLQEKAGELQKVIDKVTRGDHRASDLSSAYTALSAPSTEALLASVRSAAP